MAPLTWRNVDAPSFAGVADTLRSSNSMLNSGMDAISRALGSFQQRRSDEASNSLIADALRLQDPNAYRQALESGTLLSGRNMADISPESLNFLAKQRNNLLSNIQGEENIKSTRLNQRSLETSIAGRDFANQRARIDAGRQDSQYAAAPEAARLMASIYDDAQSGDPNRLARARQLTRENTDLLVRSGMSPRDINNFQSGNTSAFDTGMILNRNTAENQDYFTERFRREGAKGLLDAAISNFPTAQTAIDSIQSNPNIDAQTKRQVVNDLRENGGSYFQSMNPVDALLNQSLTRSLPSGSEPSRSTGSNHIQYTNQGATRNKPITDKLVRDTSFLSNAGITMEVYSGGQEGKGEGNRRTGSTRHDHGNAADVRFKTSDGRYLSEDNPADIPVLQNIFKQMRANGVSGIGAGRNYMGPDRFHIGYGSTAVWGAGGKSENAPTWLKQAFDGSPTSKQYGQAPIDTTRPVFNNQDGSVSTEQTITIGDGDDFINIPTIVQGMPVSDAEAEELYRSGQNDAVGRFKSQEEAETAAQERSDQIGRMLQEAASGSPEGSVSYTDAMIRERDAANAASSNNQSTRQITDQILQGITPETPDLRPQDAARTVANTRTADTLYDRDRNFRQNVRENPFIGKNKGQIADQLRERGMTDIPRQRLMDLLDQYSKGPNAVSPEAAAIAIEASYGGDTRGPGRRIADNIPLVGTALKTFSPRDNIDTANVDRLLNEYMRDSEGNPNVNSLVGALDQAGQAAGVMPTVEQVQTIAAQAEQEFLQAAAAAQRNPNIDIEPYRERYLQAQMLLNQMLQQAAGPASTYTRGQ